MEYWKNFLAQAWQGKIIFELFQKKAKKTWFSRKWKKQKQMIRPSWSTIAQCVHPVAVCKEVNKLIFSQGAEKLATIEM